jgi:hypothetical protein
MIINKTKLKLNLSTGISRFWIALNILVFLYMLPIGNRPLDEFDIIPYYIFDLSRIPYEFFKNLLEIPDFTSTLTTDILWAFSIALCTAFTSLVFLMLSIWVIRGFKK